VIIAMSRSFFFPVLLCSVAGCSSMSNNVSGSWSCAAPEGSCAPMTVIDQEAILSMGGSASQALPMDAPARRAPTDPLLAGFANLSNPSRTPERTLRIIFPAYVDRAGLYFEPAAVHAVVATPGWSSAPERSASVLPRGQQDAAVSAAPNAPGSALASMQEVMAARAFQRKPPARFYPQPNISPAVPEAAALSPVPENPIVTGQAAASFLPSSAAGSSLPPQQQLVPFAQSSPPPSLVAVLRVPAVPAVQSFPAVAAGPVPPVSVVVLKSVAPSLPAVKAPPLAAGVSASAPHGYRNVIWKGRAYRIPYKSPQPATVSPGNDESSAAVRALNVAALKAVSPVEVSGVAVTAARVSLSAVSDDLSAQGEGDGE